MNKEKNLVSDSRRFTAEGELKPEFRDEKEDREALSDLAPEHREQMDKMIELLREVSVLQSRTDELVDTVNTIFYSLPEAVRNQILTQYQVESEVASPRRAIGFITDGDRSKKHSGEKLSSIGFQAHKHEEKQ